MLRIKKLCTPIFQSKISLIFSCLSLISSAAAIIYFSVKLSSLSEFDYIYNYEKATCTPYSGFAYELSCSSSSSKWISIWKTKLGQWIVADPFSIRETRIEAIQDRDKYKLSGNYTCMCRYPSLYLFGEVNNIINGCSLWTECIFSEDFISYIKYDNKIYKHTFISFIVSSCISLVFCVVSIIISAYAIKTEKAKEYIEL